jgi:hypothetical protein
MVVYTYNSNIPKVTRRITKTTTAIRLLSTIPIPIIHNQSSPIAKASGGRRANYNQRGGIQRVSTKAEMQLGNALTAAPETTTPTVVLA